MYSNILMVMCVYYELSVLLKVINDWMMFSNSMFIILLLMSFILLVSNVLLIMVVVMVFSFMFCVCRL